MGTLYDTIQNLCKQKGVSGSRMCLDLGLSKSTMSDLKYGRTKGMSTATATKIASYFGVSVGYLLGEEEKSVKEKPTVQDDGLSDERKLFIDRVTQMSDAEFGRLKQILALVENTK